MRLRSPFWCHHSKKPVQGFEQGLNKVSSFQAVPTHDPPPHAYLCHFQSAFCPTLPTPPMPGASGWGPFFGSTPSRIAARHMRPPGVKPGAQAWEACMLPLHYRRHDTSQETRQWLLALAPLPCLLSLSKRFTHPAPWPSFTALEGPLPKFAIMCSKQAHVHDKVHLHQPGNEPGFCLEHCSDYSVLLPRSEKFAETRD